MVASKATSIAYRMPPKKRKLWDDTDMTQAMESVKQGESVRGAAIKFSVPRKTLEDRVKGRVEHGCKPGPRTALSKSEEDSLVSYLVFMAQRGFPLTRTMVKAFAWAIAKRSGNDERFNKELGPSEHWWTNFKLRHPRLALRKSDSLERDRAEAFNETIVNEYFELLEKTLEENQLKDKPRQIYNCDETFLPLDYTRERAVTLKGAKAVYKQATGTKEHITVLCCASAAGLPHPPMIIYSKCFPGGQYRFEGPDDALYAKSESGWIDSKLFLSWFNKIFLKYAVNQRPIMLLVDGHKSHMTIDIIDLCRSKGVILFCLPPHTTHALQPLDVSVFKALKDSSAKTVRALSFKKPNFVVTKREFVKVLKVPFERALSIPNIKAGFTKCGIYPLNPNAVSKEKMTPSTLYGASSPESALPPSSSSVSCSDSGTVSSTPSNSQVQQSVSAIATLQSSSGVSSATVSPPLFSTPSGSSVSQSSLSTPSVSFFPLNISSASQSSQSPVGFPPDN